MSTAPSSLRELAAYYTDHGGKVLGIVGDTGHTVGYHLGKDRIYDGSGPGLGDQDYSVRLARDKAGLTNAAAAIDLGRLNGSLQELYKFSRWLVAQCKADQPGHRDVREIIYSPDGVKVQRYSGVDGGIHTGDGNGDASHISHTHISYFRDSQARSKVGLFAPYFEGADMAGLKWQPTEPGQGIGSVLVKADRGLVNLRTGAVGDPLHDERPSYGRVLLAEPFPPAAPGRQTGYLVIMGGEACVALDDVVDTFVPDPVGPAPTLHRYVITVDAPDITVTQDGADV